MLNLDLLILTNGKAESIFIFKENKKLQIINKQPNIAKTVVDTSGAGDAFFASIIKHYAYNKNINSKFIDDAFKTADLNAREILKYIGSRKPSNFTL